jgi:hypothetical protein
MGFFKSIKKGFKKIGKGFKSAFKSIGKGIKSAMGKIGKFMNKIGIVGQLALMFTPVGAMMSNMFSSIGNVAGGMFSKVVGKAATQGVAGSGLLGSTSALARGAGTVLKAAGNFAKAGHAAFKTITEGMTSFIGEFSKTALKKIPGMETMMPKFLGSDVSDTFFGKGGAWSKVTGVVDENASKILASFDEQIGHTDKILTADQKNLKIKAEAQQAKAATGATYDVKGMQGVQEIDASGFNQTAFDDISKKGFKGMQEIDASGFNQTALKESAYEAAGMGIEKASQQSLLSRGTEYVSEAFDNAKEKLAQGIEDFKTDPVEALFGEDPLQKAGDRFSEQLTGTAAQRAIMGKTPATEVYYAPPPPEFNILPVGQYASAEMNDRAMQIQLSGGQFYMENPAGYGAHQYINRMAAAVGGRANV